MKAIKFITVISFVLLGMFALFSCRSSNNSQQSSDNGGSTDNADQAESVIIYPAPSCYELSEQATLSVDGKEAYIIKNQEQYDYCSFAFRDPVTVSVKVNEEIKSWSVSPLAKGYEAKAENDVLTFKMEKAEYLIVKINDLREIVICADAHETDAPKAEGQGIFNICSAPYSCVPDSAEVVTERIQQAIDDASSAGGGTVYVPAGVFLTGCINLHSNVNLYLAPGSVLRLTDNVKKLTSTWNKSSINGYTTLPTGGKGPWKGVTMITCDENSENIKIFGRGTVDGRGVYMCNNKGHVIKLFYPVSVTNLTVKDIILRDSSSWNTVIYACTDVNITNTKVFNEVHTMYEDDGIDIANSQNVTVKSCVIISEDDPASVKGMKNAPLKPCKNVVWDDVFVWTTTSAFKVGWKGYTDISDVTFKNSYAYSCKNGIGVFHYDGTGTFKDITFDNIDIENFLGKYKDGKREPTRAFFFEILDRGDGVNAVSDITVSNINFRNRADTANSMNSLNQKYNFSNIKFINIIYDGKKIGSLKNLFRVSTHAENITVE